MAAAERGPTEDSFKFRFKYFVTLLVVDQRPSGIDPEVMSQIGTRITALLNDEKDIEAIFAGVS